MQVRVRGHQARTVPSSDPEKSRGPRGGGGGERGVVVVPSAAVAAVAEGATLTIFDRSTATSALTAAVWPVRQAAGLSESACQARICFGNVFYGFEEKGQGEKRKRMQIEVEADIPNLKKKRKKTPQAFHRTVLSYDPENTSPSTLASVLTGPEWPGKAARALKVATSQTRTVPS